MSEAVNGHNNVQSAYRYSLSLEILGQHEMMIQKEVEANLAPDTGECTQ